MVLAVQEEVPLRVLVAQASVAMVVPLFVDLRLRVTQTRGPAAVEVWVRGGALERQGQSVARVSSSRVISVTRRERAGLYLLGAVPLLGIPSTLIPRRAPAH